MSNEDDSSVIAIVCDGHGGDDYIRSAVGSRLACGAANKNLTHFLKNVTLDTIKLNPRKTFEWLESSIINAWNEAIYTHFRDNPFTEQELSLVSKRARMKYEHGEIESAYGTTLIAAAITNDFWFGIQIGDGKCVAVDRDSVFWQPIPWDEKCFLNVTTSLCDVNALENFRYYFSEDLPAAVFLGTDGIDDSFSNEKQLYLLYETVVYSFGSSDFEQAVTELKDYLPRLTKKGSGDDVSIAAILDISLLPELLIVKKHKQKNDGDESDAG